MRTEQFHQRLERLLSTALSDLRSEGCEMSEEQFLGITLANHLRWNGVRVLEVAALALEDANYHRECAVVQGLIEVAKQTNKQRSKAS